MKEFKLKKDSWHFKITKHFGIVTGHESGMDFCRYFWSVTGALAITTLITAVVGFCLSVVGWLVWGWYQYFDSGFVMNESVKCTIFLSCIGAVAGIVKMLVLLVAERKKKKRAAYYAKIEAGWDPEAEQPGFIKQAYRSWKQKTCHKVTFS